MGSTFVSLEDKHFLYHVKKLVQQKKINTKETLYNYLYPLQLLLFLPSKGAIFFIFLLPASIFFKFKLPLIYHFRSDTYPGFMLSII